MAAKGSQVGNGNLEVCENDCYDVSHYFDSVSQVSVNTVSRGKDRRERDDGDDLMGYLQ